MAESAVQLRWAYSVKRQSAYQTESPSGDITQSHPFTGADMGEHTPNMSDNAAQYGKGHEFATRNEILSWDSGFRRSFQATTKILGWMFAFHTGNCTTGSLGSGAYSHACEYQDPLGTGYYGSGRQQPVATIYELVASNMIRIFPSMAIKAVEVTGAMNDWVMCSMEMQGSGMMRRIHPSSFTFPDSTSPATGGEGTGLLRNAALLFTHGVYGGSQTDISCDIRSWRFRSEMAYFDADGYCPGSGYLTSGDPHSGQIRNRLEFARRAVVFEFVAKAPSTNNGMFARLEAATKLAATLTVTGDIIGGAIRHSMIISIPQLNYRAVPIGTDGDNIVFSAATVVFYDQTEANPWKVTIQNDTSTYLASS